MPGQALFLLLAQMMACVPESLSLAVEHQLSLQPVASAPVTWDEAAALHDALILTEHAVCQSAAMGVTTC